MREKFILPLGLIILLAATPAMLSAKIQVLRSSGKRVNRGRPTTVVFKSAGSRIPIYQVLRESSATGSSTYGGTYSAYGQTTRLICEAPAKIRVSGGTYKFRAGKNIMLDKTFTVRATGGTQVWEVKSGNLGYWVLGCLLGIPGISFGIVGLAAGTNMFGPPVLWLAAGATGIGFMIAAFGSAKMVYPKKAATRENILPRREYCTTAWADEALLRDSMVYSGNTFRF